MITKKIYEARYEIFGKQYVEIFIISSSYYKENERPKGFDFKTVLFNIKRQIIPEFYGIGEKHINIIEFRERKGFIMSNFIDLWDGFENWIPEKEKKLKKK